MRNRRHEITYDEMLEYKSSKGNDEVLYAGQLPLKKLTFTLSGGYRVYHNNELVYDGLDGYWAVNRYNEI